MTVVVVVPSGSPWWLWLCGWCGRLGIYQLPDISFYDWMRRHCGLSVTHGLARLAATSADKHLAARLQIDEGAPVFRLTQVDYTAEGRPVLHAHGFHVADAFEIRLVRRGPNP